LGFRIREKIPAQYENVLLAIIKKFALQSLLKLSKSSSTLSKIIDLEAKTGNRDLKTKISSVITIIGFMGNLARHLK
jgi:hypothetical protein